MNGIRINLTGIFTALSVLALPGIGAANNFSVQYAVRDVHDTTARLIWGADRLSEARSYAGGTVAPFVNIGRMEVDGKHYYLSQLFSSDSCSAIGCPYRITDTQGEVLFDEMVCDFGERHRINAAGTMFSACNEVYRVRLER